MNGEELGRAICAVAQNRWRKVAFVIGKVEYQTGDAHDAIAERISALVAGGQLEAQGDLSEWRESEIRLLLRGVADD